MTNKNPARILHDVKRITKFLAMKKPTLVISYVNKINIPPKKPTLSLVKIAPIDVPPEPRPDENKLNDVLKENEDLRFNMNVLQFILNSYKQDESESNVEESDTNEGYKCDHCGFGNESFEDMKIHRRNVHDEDFSLI